MEILTLKDFQERFEEIIEKVEKGERIGIIGEDGKATVMIPTEDSFFRMHTEHNDAS